MKIEIWTEHGPQNSKIAATKTACFKVSTLAPTEVAKEFAQSLAPIPHAL